MSALPPPFRGLGYKTEDTNRAVTPPPFKKPTAKVTDEIPQVPALLLLQDGSLVNTIVSGEPIVLGSAADCDVYIPDSQLSEHHARLWLLNNATYIENIDNAAVSELNGQLITGPVRIQSNDTLSLGGYSLKMRFGGARHHHYQEESVELSEKWQRKGKSKTKIAVYVFSIVTVIVLGAYLFNTYMCRTVGVGVSETRLFRAYGKPKSVEERNDGSRLYSFVKENRKQLIGDRFFTVTAVTKGGYVTGISYQFVSADSCPRIWLDLVEKHSGRKQWLPLGMKAFNLRQSALMSGENNPVIVREALYQPDGVSAEYVLQPVESNGKICFMDTVIISKDGTIQELQESINDLLSSSGQTDEIPARASPVSLHDRLPPPLVIVARYGIDLNLLQRLYRLRKRDDAVGCDFYQFAATDLTGVEHGCYVMTERNSDEISLISMGSVNPVADAEIAKSVQMNTMGLKWRRDSSAPLRDLYYRSDKKVLVSHLQKTVGEDLFPYSLNVGFFKDGIPSDAVN